MKTSKLLLLIVVLLLPFSAYAQGITWYKDYKEAAAASLASGKPLLIDFTADWCKPCQVMEQTFWISPRVTELRDRFIFAKIDFDKSRNVATKYGVLAIPNIIVRDSWGMVLVSNLGFGGKAEENIFRKIAYVPMDFSTVREAGASLEADKNDAKALTTFADFYERYKFYYVSNEFNQRLYKLEKDPLKREDLLLRMGGNYLRNSLPEEAIEMLEKLVKDFPTSVQVDKALYAQMIAYQRLGKPKNVLKTFDRLKTKVPNSPLIAEAQKILAEVNAGPK